MADTDEKKAKRPDEAQRPPKPDQADKAVKATRRRQEAQG